MNHHTLIKIALIVLTSYGIYYMAHNKSATTHDNTLHVGTNAEYRPFAYSDNGRVVGFDIDLIKEIGKRLGKKVEVHDMAFTALIPDIQYGNIHVIAAGMSSTPMRSQQVNFTKPYLTGDPLLAISLKDSAEYTDLGSLKNKEVIVNQGFTADMQLSVQPDINLKRLDSVADAFLALQNERGDVFVTARCSVDPYFEQHSQEGFTISELKGLAADNYALAVSKEYPELLTQIQTILDDMQKEGYLKELQQKWNINGTCAP